jgi:hypothetical protein
MPQRNSCFAEPPPRVEVVPFVRGIGDQGPALGPWCSHGGVIDTFVESRMNLWPRGPRRELLRGVARCARPPLSTSTAEPRLPTNGRPLAPTRRTQALLRKTRRRPSSAPTRRRPGMRRVTTRPTFSTSSASSPGSTCSSRSGSSRSERPPRALAPHTRFRAAFAAVEAHSRGAAPFRRGVRV